MKDKLMHRRLFSESELNLPSEAEEAELARESMRRIPLSDYSEDAEKTEFVLETRSRKAGEETEEAELVELLLFPEVRQCLDSERSLLSPFAPTDDPAS